ncbi:MAG TPA: hypothetical protein PKD91_13685 [Bacteroidia bacterium]|nr:hypothetical protein [Bacteroidia bacterium]
MSSSVDLFDQEILQRYHLSIEEIKSAKGKRRVYLVRDAQDNSLKILKINLAFPLKLEREYQFLSTASSLKFTYLKTPQVYAYSTGMILMEYLDCENYTRDTILDKNWSPQECKKWINALNEFQSIPTSSKGFTFYEIVKGALYPVIRSLEIRKQIFRTLTFRELLTFTYFLIQYKLIRLFIKNVTTHYDFNTFNFTNLRGSDKMSLIDFEMGAYKGDSLYDLLYYISLPTTAIDNWTFQSILLEEWTKMNKTPFQKIRIKVILCIISFQRIRRFEKEPLKAEIYRKNLRRLLE